MRRRLLYSFGLLLLLHNFAFSKSDSTWINRQYYGIGAGMGITLINSTDIVDYLNTSFQQPSRIDDFGVAPEFFGFGTFPISEMWSAKIEYAFIFKSYSTPVSGLPDFTFSFNVHMPTMLIEYSLINEGFFFKFGGGLGYHVAQFSKNLNISDTLYQSSGIGLKLEAEGNTAFDEHLFGTIGLDVRANFMSEFKDTDGNNLFISAIKKNARMNFFAIGLKFGVAYYF